MRYLIAQITKGNEMTWNKLKCKSTYLGTESFMTGGKERADYKKATVCQYKILKSVTVEQFL